MNLWQDEMPRFRPAAFEIRRAVRPSERAGHFRLREDFFCRQQRIFAHTDRDAIDAHAVPIVAVSLLHGDADEVVGAVRIHHDRALDAWWGSRLCVAPQVRGDGGIGTALIRFAVGIAHAAGCTRFLAHVQMQNVALFRRVGWEVQGERELLGHPHALMQADLERFPPILSPGLVHIPDFAPGRLPGAAARRAASPG